MKRLLILTLTTLLSFTLIGSPKENPKIVDEYVTDWVLDQLDGMGYVVLPEIIVQDTLNRKGQNPKREFDDLYYNPKMDNPRQPRHRGRTEQIIDTLVKENPNIVVNNYYNDDPFYYSHNISRFYHSGFNYWMYSDPFLYSNYDWSWEFRFMRNSYWPYSNFYFVDRYDYWGWNSWMYNPWRFNFYGYNNNNHYNNYYGNNNFNHNFNNPNAPQYGRRDRPSNLTQGNPPSDRRFEGQQPQRNRINPTQQRTPQNMKQYSESRRSYTPTYENPKMGTRPNFNNARMENRRTNMENAPQGRMNNGMNMENRRMMVPNTPMNNSNNMDNRRSESPIHNQSNSNYDVGSRNSGGGTSGTMNSSGGSARRR